MLHIVLRVIERHLERTIPGAAVRIAGDDRAGLERLLRDWARPVFALERLIARSTPIRSSAGFPNPSRTAAPRCPSPR